MHVLLGSAITASRTVGYLALRRLKHRMCIATCEVLPCEQESAVPVVVDAAAPGVWPLGMSQSYQCIIYSCTQHGAQCSKLIHHSGVLEVHIIPLSARYQAKTVSLAVAYVAPVRAFKLAASQWPLRECFPSNAKREHFCHSAFVRGPDQASEA